MTTTIRIAGGTEELALKLADRDETSPTAVVRRALQALEALDAEREHRVWLLRERLTARGIDPGKVWWDDARSAARAKVDGETFVDAAPWWIYHENFTDSATLALTVVEPGSPFGEQRLERPAE